MTVEERLSLLDKVIYGSGEWTSAIAGTTRSLFLNYFLVSVVGLVPRATEKSRGEGESGLTKTRAMPLDDGFARNRKTWISD